MTLHNTYKYGSLYVDAALTLENLKDEEKIGEVRAEIVELLKNSDADFTFDDDWAHGSMYSVDGQDTPLVLIGTFGGYPGESMDEANAEAAKEWSADRYYIYSFSSWFGGCEIVSLYLNWDECTLDEATEAVELAEGFREYPVLDEDLWSTKQFEVWESMIDEMVVDSENEHDIVFTEEQRAYIYETAAEKYGYWEEGYFDQDEWDTIIEEVMAAEPGTVVQLHQSEKLF